LRSNPLKRIGPPSINGMNDFLSKEIISIMHAGMVSFRILFEA
jgi:hypothetical protein